MDIPAFISLNGSKIKIQRWQLDGNVILFTTLIRGEHLGKDVIAAASEPSVRLVVDDDTELTGQLKILNQRTSGAGVTSALRLEMHFTADVDSMQKLEPTTDEKLDAILQELRALRREVALLGGSSLVGNQGSISPGKPGTTMLDFEIPVKDDSEK